MLGARARALVASPPVTARTHARKKETPRPGRVPLFLSLSLFHAPMPPTSSGGVITSSPPMNGRSTGGTTTLPSAC